MSPLFISLGAGALIGLIYSLLKVRSPAPPAVALVGLLGMVIGSTLGGKWFHSDTPVLVPSNSQTQPVAVKQSASLTLNAKQAN